MTSASPARFITLEGGEGAGKSTQATMLAAALQTCGIACVSTREPGGSPGAETIRKLIVEGEPARWDALAETLLLAAARSDHLARTIRPALARGIWVVCDRFSDSTYAYQGAGRGLDARTIRSIESAATGDFKPDFTLILDLPSEAGLARSHTRSGREKRFENFDREFHERLRAHYLALPQIEPRRCAVIDATDTIDDVAQSIWRAVASRYGL